MQLEVRSDQPVFPRQYLLLDQLGGGARRGNTSPADWAAALSASVILPAFSHVVEFTVHSLRRTPRLGTSVSVSIAFSVLTVLFNVYAMRHGVLLVGGENRTLLQDLAPMPRIIAGLVASVPKALWTFLRRRHIT